MTHEPPTALTDREVGEGAWPDRADVRASLLTLVVDLALLLLRRRGQAARALTLQLAFSGGGQWEKTRRPAEPSAHEEDLRALAYQLMDAAGVQLGRLTGISLRGEELVDADQVAEQISREARLVAERAVDRVRAKFGPDVIGPAAVFPRASWPVTGPGGRRRRRRGRRRAARSR